MMKPEAVPFTDDVLDQAIGWQVTLLSGTADDATRQRWLNWRAANSQHERAWLALQQSERLFGELSEEDRRLARGTLARSDRRRQVDRQRRRVIKALGVAALAAPVAVLWREYNGTLGWPVDYATRAGEQRTVELADGSVLRLNTASAVDVHFSSQARAVLLRRGEIHVRVEAGAPPFQILTQGRRISLAAGELLVHQRDDHLYTLVQRGAVQLAYPDGIQRLAEGGWRAGAQGVLRDDDPVFDPSGWIDGALIARDMPLPRFLSELSRYQQGWLRHDPALASLRVSGVFQLDDTRRSLAALTRVLPVRIVDRSPLWTRIVPA